MQLALQLYTVRTLAKDDMARTLTAVAEAGYTAVETAGYGNLNAVTLRTSSIAPDSTQLLLMWPMIAFETNSQPSFQR